MRNVKNHHYAIGNHLIAAQYHALTEKSTMAARCNGLIKMGILRKCGKRKCSVTGREVEMLKLNDGDSENGQLELF